MAKRKELRGQVNLEGFLVDPPVVVAGVTDDGVVTIRSVEDPSRSANFILVGGELKKTGGWLPLREFKNAVRIARGILCEGDHNGRFA